MGRLSESAVILVVVAMGVRKRYTALPEMQSVFELSGARFVYSNLMVGLLLKVKDHMWESQIKIYYVGNINITWLMIVS